MAEILALPAKAKSPLASAPAGFERNLLLVLAVSSARSSPPAWSSHDGGDDDDGGGSASGIEIMKAGAVCQMRFG
jgi:hypothetical protein